MSIDRRDPPDLTPFARVSAAVRASSLWRRVWARVVVDPDTHWIYDGASNANGYPRVWVSKTERPNVLYVHRLTLGWATGNLGMHLDACHDDSKGCPRSCVNPAHLAWKSHRDNMKDVISKHGRICPRGDNPMTPVATRPLPLFDEAA